jgi:hypothetical protein
MASPRISKSSTIPRPWRAGHDPQLERAVEVVLAQLKKNPLPVYKRPRFPNYDRNAATEAGADRRHRDPSIVVRGYFVAIQAETDHSGCRDGDPLSGQLRNHLATPIAAAIFNGARISRAHWY